MLPVGAVVELNASLQATCFSLDRSLTCTLFDTNGPTEHFVCTSKIFISLVALPRISFHEAKLI